MIPLATGKSEEPFFQNWIVPIPEGQGKADQLVPIANTGEAIFVPTICTGSRIIVRKRFPCLAITTVVLAYRSPCSFAQVRTPTFPMALPSRVLLETQL